MANILVAGLHVYLLQNLVKILEEEGHFVVAVYSSDLIGVNLRKRKFDLVLINADVDPRFRDRIEQTVQRYQVSCPVADAIYERRPLLDLVERLI